MLSIKLALICAAIGILSCSVPSQGKLEECVTDYLHRDAVISHSKQGEICEKREYHYGDLSPDGCRLTCSDLSRRDVIHIPRRKPLKCCSNGLTVGYCINGLCRPEHFNPEASKDYRRYIITVSDFTTIPDGPPPKQVRLKMFYKKARFDTQASYLDEDIICETELNQVHRKDRDHYNVRFDFTCTTAFLHKLASIKFLLEDPDVGLKYEQVARLRDPLSGILDMGSGEEFDILRVVMSVKPEGCNATWIGPSESEHRRVRC